MDVIEHDIVDEPHRHRPATWSEPYEEFGRHWVIPVCECGVALPARLVTFAGPVQPADGTYDPDFDLNPLRA